MAKDTRWLRAVVISASLSLCVACGSTGGSPEPEPDVVPAMDTGPDDVAVPDTARQPDAGTDPADSTGCGGATPLWSAELGRCCECLVAWDCGGYACSPADCVCTDELGADCSICVGDTPRCLTEAGQFVACVQCLSASDCPGLDETCKKNLCL